MLYSRAIQLAAGYLVNANVILWNRQEEGALFYQKAYDILREVGEHYPYQPVLPDSHVQTAYAKIMRDPSRLNKLRYIKIINDNVVIHGRYKHPSVVMSAQPGVLDGAEERLIALSSSLSRIIGEEIRKINDPVIAPPARDGVWYVVDDPAAFLGEEQLPQEEEPRSNVKMNGIIGIWE